MVDGDAVADELSDVDENDVSDTDHVEEDVNVVVVLFVIVGRCDNVGVSVEDNVVFSVMVALTLSVHVVVEGPLLLCVVLSVTLPEVLPELLLEALIEVLAE